MKVSILPQQNHGPNSLVFIQFFSQTQVFESSLTTRSSRDLCHDHAGIVFASIFSNVVGVPCQSLVSKCLGWGWCGVRCHGPHTKFNAFPLWGNRCFASGPSLCYGFLHLITLNDGTYAVHLQLQFRGSFIRGCLRVKQLMKIHGTHFQMEATEILSLLQ